MNKKILLVLLFLSLVFVASTGFNFRGGLLGIVIDNDHVKSPGETYLDIMDIQGLKDTKISFYATTEAQTFGFCTGPYVSDNRQRASICNTQAKAMGGFKGDRGCGYSSETSCSCKPNKEFGCRGTRAIPFGSAIDVYIVGQKVGTLEKSGDTLVLEDISEIINEHCKEEFFQQSKTRQEVYCKVPIKFTGGSAGIAITIQKYTPIDFSGPNPMVSVQIPDKCSNGILDSDEVDVDCGGSCNSCQILVPYTGNEDLAKSQENVSIENNTIQVAIDTIPEEGIQLADESTIFSTNEKEFLGKDVPIFSLQKIPLAMIIGLFFVAFLTFLAMFFEFSVIIGVLLFIAYVVMIVGWIL